MSKYVVNVSKYVKGEDGLVDELIFDTREEAENYLKGIYDQYVKDREDVVDFEYYPYNEDEFDTELVIREWDEDGEKILNIVVSTSKLEQEYDDIDLEDGLDDYDYDEFEEIEKLEKEVQAWRQLIVDFVSENGLNEQFIDWLQKKNTNGDLDKYIGRFIVLLSEKANSDTIIN
ncbi:hypothetical protein [Geobacillus sp. B4113_201601]|uniref:hypothetical protein n=1 Tax=Geobacillus sp. B4113_201601 TaxID=1586290 RepID=UPI0007821A2D|nr:hypothetical protein [Geobacillus sp. B4113_201601]KYD29943.1 hypothetical protein B4113_1178 [Geobacillus sp. B4113_201601]